MGFGRTVSVVAAFAAALGMLGRAESLEPGAYYRHKAVALVNVPGGASFVMPDLYSGESAEHPLPAPQGTPPFRWLSAGGPLPPGITLSPDGVIRGTPTASGTYGNLLFTVSGQGGGSSTIGPFSSTVYAPLAMGTPDVDMELETGDPVSVPLVTSGGKQPLSWDVASGSLPPGVQVGAGMLTGAPSSPGSYSATVRARDANSRPVTVGVSMLVIDPIVVSGGDVGDLYVGDSVDHALVASGGVAPVTWTLASGTVPAGLTLDPAGRVTGSPSQTGSFSFGALASDLSDREEILVVSGEVHALPTVANAPAGYGYRGAEYPAFAYAANGGKAPHAWTVSAGNLPEGMALSGSGILSGTPTEVGTSSFTVRVTDATGRQATQASTISIYAPPVLASNSGAGGGGNVSGAVADGYVGTTYSAPYSISGGAAPHRWSVASGTLPAGLELDKDSGILSGTPTAAGNSSFVVRATDANGTPANMPSTIAVYEAPAVAGTPSAEGYVGAEYPAFTYAQTGGKGPYKWAVATGAVPAGMALSEAGILSGTPTAAGTSNFTVRVEDANGVTATSASSVAVYATPTVTNAPSANGWYTDTAYSFTFTAAGGKAGYAWSVVSGAVPTGMSLGANGVLSGTPGTAGNYNFTVRVTDANGQTADRAVSVVVFPPPQATNQAGPDNYVGYGYSFTFSSWGGRGPHTWSVVSGAPPAGTTLGTNGVLSGTTTVAGTYYFTVRVTDANGRTADRANAIAVYAPPSVTNTPTTDGYRGSAYPTFTYSVANGKPGHSWGVVAGAVPSGMAFNSAGQLYGTPSAAGTYNFTVRVWDANGWTADRASTIVVYAPPVISGAAPSSGTVGTAYGHTFARTGGKAPFTWTWVSGTRPAGTTWTASTARLAGTPTTATTYTFTVRVTDANGRYDDQANSVRIYANTSGVWSAGVYSDTYIAGSSAKPVGSACSPKGSQNYYSTNSGGGGGESADWWVQTCQ